MIPDSVANAQLSDTRAHGIAFSPNGALLVAFGGNNTLRYYDAATRKAVTQPDPVGEREVRTAVINDAFVLAAGSDDGTITIRYPQSGREQRVLSGHTDGISGLAVVSGTDRR